MGGSFSSSTPIPVDDLVKKLREFDGPTIQAGLDAVEESLADPRYEPNIRTQSKVHEVMQITRQFIMDADDEDARGRGNLGWGDRQKIIHDTRQQLR